MWTESHWKKLGMNGMGQQEGILSQDPRSGTLPDGTDPLAVDI